MSARRANSVEHGKATVVISSRDTCHCGESLSDVRGRLVETIGQATAWIHGSSSE